MMDQDRKKRDIVNRIQRLESELDKAPEYLDQGSNAEWHKFRTLFNPKVVNGKQMPPHKDWVKHVFIPERQALLKKAEKLIENIERAK